MIFFIHLDDESVVDDSEVPAVEEFKVEGDGSGLPNDEEGKQEGNAPEVSR